MDSYTATTSNIEQFNSELESFMETIQSLNRNTTILFHPEKLIKKSPEKVAITALDGIYYLDRDEILYVESDKNHSTIITTKREIISSQSLKKFTALLEAPNFFKAHVSFIINLNHVVKLNKREGYFIEMVSGKKIPLSRSNKNAFLNQMESILL